ncbi:MAG: hypothetical protein B7Y72_08335, partial [Mehylophilales bacterium 35-46-6]
MNKFISLLKSNYESLLLIVVVLLLLLAIYKPQIQLKQDVHNYLLVADVSQSMNAQDLKLNNKTISRLDYTKHLMKRVVETSSCGTYISLGVFAAENVGLLLMPLEVCANYDVITDTIDHLEWRMAWRGNSRLSFGIKSAESMFDYLNIPATMLFFTDGDEAPKVNAINKLDLSGVQIGKNLLFVGVGGSQPVPVPRYNSSNKWVGYWSSETKENSAGAVGDTYSDTSKDEPDPIVAYAEFDRYLSQLDSEYLKQVSEEIKGGYIEGKDTQEFYSYIQSQKPSASFVTAYSLKWLYLTLAVL